MTRAPLSLPRILCLHGGGVNAEVFALQARGLIAFLAPSFRLVFADGPHFCDKPGPGIELVYGGMGPFRRWLRWIPGEHGPLDDELAAEEIRYSVRAAMRDDPGTGPWLGLLGFSQGAKVAASLLFETQCGDQEWDWRFAVAMQGRFPLVSLGERTRSPALVNPGDLAETFDYRGEVEPKLRLPTVHVHGLADPGLELHRRLMDQYCEPESVTLVEWDGDHRLPVKKQDVARVCEAIIKVARAQGIDC